MSEVLDARTSPHEEIIARTVEVLTQGRLVALPTDTVYGLAASAADGKAVRRIFKVKGRAPDNPLPLLIASAAELPVVTSQVPQNAWRLARQFWPGPLTVVVPKSPVISNAVTAGRLSVAVRVPDYPLTQAILQACPFPVAVTSANLSGQPALIEAEQVAEAFVENIDLLLTAEPCPGAQPSTVIDLTTSPPVLLRTGPVSIAELQDVVGPVQPDASASTNS